jgi:hypothetical protein
LEANKPQQVFTDIEFKFGASTRSYILRERPQMNKNFPSILNTASNANNSSMGESNDENETSVGMSASNLPESEAELEV